MKNSLVFLMCLGFAAPSFAGNSKTHCNLTDTDVAERLSAVARAEDLLRTPSSVVGPSFSNAIDSSQPAQTPKIRKDP